VRAAVFLNGAPDPPYLLRQAARSADLIVAADGGARHALEAGILPGVVVGDMDSLGEEKARSIEGQGAVLERHPAKKDKMDGHLALLAARERGATEAAILCASGGSIAAFFALPHLLLLAERIGLAAVVVAGWGVAFVVENGSKRLDGAPGDGVSVFPVVGPAEGVTLESMAYPLRDARLEPGDTLGFHNELTGGGARVEVRNGALLVIHEPEELAV
jgi:thiamine pyrophosphokinase